MDLNKHVYNMPQVTNNYDLLLTATLAIEDYVDTNYENAADLRTCLVIIKLPALMGPALPDASNAVEIEIWKLDLCE